MVALFGKAKSTISEHLKHIFEEGELDQNEQKEMVSMSRKQGDAALVGCNALVGAAARAADALVIGGRKSLGFGTEIKKREHFFFFRLFTVIPADPQNMIVISLNQPRVRRI